MNMHDKLYAYAEAYFQKRQKTEFPTVRRAARALRVKQSDIIDAIDGDPQCRMMHTGHNFVQEGDRDFPGSLFVETI